MERKQFKTYTFNLPRPIGIDKTVTAIRIEQGMSGTWWIESLDKYGRVYDRRSAKDKDAANRTAAVMFNFFLHEETLISDIEQEIA